MLFGLTIRQQIRKQILQRWIPVAYFTSIICYKREAVNRGLCAGTLRVSICWLFQASPLFDSNRRACALSKSYEHDTTSHWVAVRRTGPATRPEHIHRVQLRQPFELTHSIFALFWGKLTWNPQNTLGHNTCVRFITLLNVIHCDCTRSCTLRELCTFWFSNTLIRYSKWALIKALYKCVMCLGLKWSDVFTYNGSIYQ